MAKKPHATFVPMSGARSPAFLPVAGELYWVDTLLYTASDPAPRRPAVVLDVPEPAHSPIRIATRTTVLSVRGVPHAVQPQWSLEEGVFSDLNSVRKDDWCSPRVSLIGSLDQNTMDAVRRRFE